MAQQALFGPIPKQASVSYAQSVYEGFEATQYLPQTKHV